MEILSPDYCKAAVQPVLDSSPCAFQIARNLSEQLLLKIAVAKVYSTEIGYGNVLYCYVRWCSTVQYCTLTKATVETRE